MPRSQPPGVSPLSHLCKGIVSGEVIPPLGRGSPNNTPKRVVRTSPSPHLWRSPVVPTGSLAMPPLIPSLLRLRSRPRGRRPRLLYSAAKSPRHLFVSTGGGGSQPRSLAKPRLIPSLLRPPNRPRGQRPRLLYSAAKSPRHLFVSTGGGGSQPRSLTKRPLIAIPLRPPTRPRGRRPRLLYPVAV